MLHLLVPLATGGSPLGDSPWGLIVLVALAGLTYWFMRRRRARQERERQPEDDDKRI